jgi:hypothetical protein
MIPHADYTMDYDYLYVNYENDLPVSHVYSPLQPRSSSPSTYELTAPSSTNEVDNSSDDEEHKSYSIVVDSDYSSDEDEDDDENYPGWLYWGIPLDAILYIGMLSYTCLHTTQFHSTWWVPIVWLYTMFYNLIFYYSLVIECSEEELVEPWMTTWWAVRWGIVWRYVFLLTMAIISQTPYEQCMYHYVLTTLHSMFVYTLLQSTPNTKQN